jgi:tetratricopeptide (TPR) repeat protein
MQRPSTFAWPVAALALVISFATLVAESQPDCLNAFDAIGRQRNCTPAPSQAPSVARAPEPKDRFVEALRQFLQAIAGQYGDEGRTSLAAIDAMELAIAEWDRAIRADEIASTSQPRIPDLHAALGLIYLDRRRLDDALREFGAASELDPRRADIQTFRGLAFGLVGKPVEVTQAFTEAAALDPEDPTTSYRLAQHLANTAQPEQAARARQQFREAQQNRLAQTAAGGAVASRFIRVDLLRQAANVAPIFPPALYADGFVALKQGRYTEAIARFREAAAVDPLSVSDATIAQARQGAAALRRGQLPEALEHLTASVESAPNVGETHRVLGMAYWADEQFDNGIEQFKTAIRLRADDERARVALGDVLVAAGRLVEAEQALKDTIRTLPESGQAHYNLGRLYDLEQKWSDAAEMFQAAANLNPVVGLDYLYQTIARMYLSLPDFGRAIDAATKRIDVNPNNAEAHRVLGDLYLRQGNDEEALTELLAALLIDPQSAESFSGIAQAYLRTGRYSEAEKASRRALEIDPAHMAARYALAAALIRIGRAEEGAKELERYRQLQAEAQLREQRDLELKMLQQEASASLAKEDYDLAIAALQKAVSYESTTPSSYLNLGVVLKRAGRHEEAIQNLLRAAELKAGPEVYRLLAEAYEALGQTEESQKYRATYARAKGERLQKAGWTR